MAILYFLSIAILIQNILSYFKAWTKYQFNSVPQSYLTHLPPHQFRAWLPCPITTELLKFISPWVSDTEAELWYFDHLMWRPDSLEKALMLGKTDMRRRRWQEGCVNEVPKLRIWKLRITQAVHHLVPIKMNRQIKSYSKDKEFELFLKSCVSKTIKNTQQTRCILLTIPHLLNSPQPQPPGSLAAWSNFEKTDINRSLFL